MAKGGIARIGLKEGMNRRTFMKIFSGLVALPIIGKGLKPLKVGKTVTQVPIIKTDNVPGKPEWFDQLVNKVIIEDAKNKGATIATGGNPHSLGGLFFEPTVLTGVSDEMLIAQEETFGPIAPIFSFDSEKEVLERANNTPYGLAAYFYTSDLKNEVLISYKGTVPSLFLEEKGVIVDGILKDKKYFIANRILAKHDENYMPPKIKDKN